MIEKEHKHRVMWNVISKLQIGKYHLEKGMLCQDQVIYKEKGRCQSIVLADGISDYNESIPCVKEVIEKTAELMLYIIDDSTDKWTLKYNVVQIIMTHVIRIISKHMEQTGLPMNAFGSTLLGLSINLDTNQYLLLHLGDGIILGRNNRKIRVLSYPVKGMSNQTLLTISENTMKYTRVSFGDLQSLNQIWLCSDGLYNDSVSKFPVVGEIWEDICKKKMLPIKEDDQGYIMLKKEKMLYERVSRHSRW